MKPETKVIIKCIVFAIIFLGLVFAVSYISYADNPILKTIIVNEGDFVKIKPLAIDVDGDDLFYKYSYPLNENGEWQTDYGDRGEYIINVSISDSKNIIEKKILLIVNKVNKAPDVELQPEYWLEEGEKIKVAYKISDFDNDKLRIKFSEPLNDNGEWQTKLGDEGIYNITLSVSDGEYLIEKSARIIVQYKNRKPFFSDFYPTEDLELIEGETLNLGIVVDDVDDDELSITWYKDSVESSQINGKENQVEYVFGYEESGNHTIRVVVKDSDNNQIEKTWNVIVEDVNRLPEITKNEISVNEGEKVILEIPSIDEDGDTIIYKISDPVGNNKEWETTYEDAGTYDVIVEMFDGKQTINQTINLIVNDVDRAPIIGEGEIISLSEGNNEFELVCYDQDGDDVMYTIDVLDAYGNKINITPDIALEDIENMGWRMNINLFVPHDYIKHSSTLRKAYDKSISFMTFYMNEFIKSSTNFSYISQEYNENEYIQFSCCGKEKCTDAVFPTNIVDNNQQPVILVNGTERYNTIVLNAKEGEEVKFDYDVYDGDGDSVDVEISEPLGNDGSWKLDYEKSGEHRGNITLQDPFEIVTRDYVIIVENTNRQPTLDAKHPLYVNENDTIRISLDMFDPDGDELNISLENFPYEYKTINNTIEFSVPNNFVDHINKTPGALYSMPDMIREGLNAYFNSNYKELNFTIIASDEESSAKHNVSMIVSDVNQKPLFMNIYPEYKTFKIGRNVTIEFKADVTDYDNDQLTYSWEFNGKIKRNTTSDLKMRFTKPGIKNIKLIADDGYEEHELEWKILVK